MKCTSRTVGGVLQHAQTHPYTARDVVQASNRNDSAKTEKKGLVRGLNLWKIRGTHNTLLYLRVPLPCQTVNL